MIGIGLEEAGVQLDARGFIQVNDRLEILGREVDPQQRTGTSSTAGTLAMARIMLGTRIFQELRQSVLEPS